MNDAPVGEAIVFCDSLEGGSGEEAYSLLGCYNTLQVESCPVRIEIKIFLAIAGSVGSFPIEILMTVDDTKQNVATTNCNIASMYGPAKFLVSAKIEFPKPGIYTFEVYCDGVFLLQKPLTVQTSGTGLRIHE